MRLSLFIAINIIYKCIDEIRNYFHNRTILVTGGAGAIGVNLVIALSNLVGDEGKIVVLDKPNLGLYISPMIWREVTPIENNGICMVLASRKYEEEDYIHDYKEFISLVR